MSTKGLVQGGTTRGSGLTQAGGSGSSSGGLWDSLKLGGNSYGDIGGNSSGFNYYGTLNNGSKGWNTDTTSFIDGGISGAKDVGLFDSLGMDDIDLGGIASLAGGIANFYLGNKQMGLYEDVMNRQLDMAEEKWGMTKEELGRITRVRQNLNAGYVNGGNYVQQEANNPSERPSKYPV